MGAGFARRDAASMKGTVMSEIVTEPVVEAPAEAVEPVVTAEPLGEAGLAALKTEREARAAAEKRLKEFEDRDKTEAQKQAEETETLRRENAELKSGKLRAEVAAAKGVPANLLSGSSQAELEASADALIAFRGEKPAPSLLVPKEGNSPKPQPNSESEFVNTLFSSGD